MLELKIEKGTEYIVGWESKGLYNSKPIALHDAFLSNVKYFGIKIRIQNNRTNQLHIRNCKCLHRL